MRLDKYLKLSRLIKRRTVANDVCTNGGVQINGKTAKPSAEVKTGDIIEITVGQKKVRIEVLSTAEINGKEAAAGMYRELS